MLTEKRLSLVDDIIVFQNSLKFYPIVITEVTVVCNFSLFTQYHGLDDAPIKFRMRLPQELRDLFLARYRSINTGQTKSETLFAGK